MLNRRFLLYLVIGGVNTVVGYGLYSGMLLLGLHYAAATVLATILSVLFNFKSTGRMVFENNDNRLLWRFIVVYALICLFNVLFLRIYAVFDDNMYLAGLVIILPSAIVSFALLRQFVFFERPCAETSSMQGEKVRS